MVAIVGMAWKLALAGLVFGVLQAGFDIKLPLKAFQSGTAAAAEDRRPVGPSAATAMLSKEPGSDLRFPGIRELADMTRENFRKASDALGR